jgi:hypothetical protein
MFFYWSIARAFFESHFDACSAEFIDIFLQSNRGKHCFFNLTKQCALPQKDLRSMVTPQNAVAMKRFYSLMQGCAPR